MRIDLITLFPECFDQPLSCGLMQRARVSGLVDLRFHNPRSVTVGPHHTVDDRPYGGGPGMVMLLEPLAKTLRALGWRDSAPGPGRLILLSPRGRKFDQGLAEEFAREERLTIICGRYEGFDARLENLFPTEAVSVGDFVLNGGEVAALSLIEATARLLPGFMGHEDSGREESFSAGALEYPHYTRPEVFEGLEVPAVLRSGNHAEIAAWRRQESLRATSAQRPDLLDKAGLSRTEMDFLRGLPRARPGRNLFCALVHHPVLDKDEKSVAVSLTNLDIHDIARSSCSYGLAAFYVVTPFKDQLALLDKLCGHWVSGPGARSNPDRRKALELVRGVESIAAAVSGITERCGQAPLLVATSAQGAGSLGFEDLRRQLNERPVLLLLGTGHGLAPEALDLCGAVLPPLRWAGEYNHLSVRAAAAIMMDRILGDWR